MTTYWFDRCPVRTHFCDALSALFPAWETAFAKIVAAYKEDITDPELMSRMDQFIAQETAHGNAHHAHNARRGITHVEAEEFAKIRLVLQRPKMKVWLAAMVSIEHLAAHLSRYFLTTFGGRHGREFALFRWHSVEELEHKSLAIDLWDALGYSRAELRSLTRRNLWYVLHFLVRYTADKLWAERVLPSPRVLYGAGWFMRRVVGMLLAFRDLTKPAFHPDHVDDAVLIQRYA